jgi:hypothetical protein
MFKKPSSAITAATNFRLPLLSQRKSSVLPFGAAYTEDVEFCQNRKSTWRVAACTCNKQPYRNPEETRPIESIGRIYICDCSVVAAGRVGGAGSMSAHKLMHKGDAEMTNINLYGQNPQPEMNSSKR